MSLLLDRILAHLSLPEFESDLRTATVLKATNVAEYLFAEPREKPYSFSEDYPNVAPPWPNFFVEFDMPQEIVGPTPRGVERLKWYGPKTFGLHWRAAERSRPDFGPLENLLRFAIDGLPPTSSKARAYLDATERARWIAYVLMYHEFAKHEPSGPEWAYLFPISETGKFFLMPPGSEEEDTLIMIVAPCDPNRLPGEVSDTIMRVVLMALSASLLTVSFCHCSNVAVTEIAPPKKLSKRYEERYGRPLLRYHVIEIDPVRRILESEGQASREGLGRALHICRGHFKHYVARGLFGKLLGTYWWPAHVRGNPRIGISLADYSVGEPGKSIDVTKKPVEEP